MKRNLQEFFQDFEVHDSQDFHYLSQKLPYLEFGDKFEEGFEVFQNLDSVSVEAFVVLLLWI